MSTRSIRVVVADDDDDLRAAITGIVETEQGMHLAGAASSGPDVVALCARERPDVAVIDVGMPGGGSPAARGIKRVSPGTHILVLSGHGDRETVLAMIEAGADSYLVKSSDIDAIIGAIRRGSSGQGSLSTEVTGGVLEELTGQLGVRRRAEEKKRRSHERIQRVMKDESQRLIVFQPIVDIDSRKPVAVEALTRFYGTPRRSPDKWFAEAAEVSASCVRDLEVACATSALSALEVLRDDLSVSVNLSPSTLSSAAFRRLLSQHDGRRVIIEITEHAAVKDYNQLRSTLCEIRKAGARIAVDDAGAGFASLRHILRFEPEIIKLDQELTSGIATDRQQQALATGLIAFALRVGAQIVAEGIESEAQVTMLRALGVRLGQGYHFAHPAPLTPELRA